jgi:putative Mg2+ transporter-C (MgtC) family protein
MGPLDLSARLAVAAALGAALGFEREMRRHPAGARTHALVAVGAALFTVAGAYGFGDTGRAGDPSRVAAQVVSGIGFLGAGAILRQGLSVRGLNTAATLWLSAALGVAVGAGMFLAAFVAASVTLVVLVGVRLVSRWVVHQGRHLLLIEYERGHGTLGPLLRELEHCHGTVSHLHLEDDGDGPGIRRAELEVVCRDDQLFSRFVHEIAIRPEVVSVSCQDSSG